MNTTRHLTDDERTRLKLDSRRCFARLTETSSFLFAKFLRFVTFVRNIRESKGEDAFWNVRGESGTVVGRANEGDSFVFSAGAQLQPRRRRFEFATKYRDNHVGYCCYYVMNRVRYEMKWCWEYFLLGCADWEERHIREHKCRAGLSAGKLDCCAVWQKNNKRTCENTLRPVPGFGTFLSR